MLSALNHPPPVTDPVAPLPRAPAAPPRRPFRRLFRWLLLLLVLVVASLFIPAVFQFAVRELLTVEAWRHGSRIEIEQVTGSFSEPVRLKNTRWTYSSAAGSVARISLEEAEALFDWQALPPWESGRRVRH